ncbi:MAG: PEP-utilizing enzyme [bacterium]
MDHYKTLGVLTVIIDDDYTSYLPREVMVRTLADGVDLFSDLEKFEYYEAEFRNYMEEVKTYATSLDYEIATKEEVGKLLDDVARLFYYYSKTEFFYTDSAYKIFAETNEAGLGGNLERLGRLKNDGRTFLNEIFFGADAVLPTLLKGLERRFGISERVLQQYSRKEILVLFAGEQLAQHHIDDRNNAFYILGKGNEVLIKTGAEARADILEFLTDIKHEHRSEIKGVTANPGQAKGVARVIRSGYDNFDALHQMMEVMQQGDILIAETTSPELMLACQKAAAIVTDQGGMLSHAAIVSRELNIPCIVGTGNATDIIKDGDLVEVDAEKGIIKIL